MKTLAITGFERYYINLIVKFCNKLKCFVKF